MRPIRRRRRDRDVARTPEFGPLVLHGIGAVILAIGGAVGLYLFLAWLLGVSPHLTGAGTGHPALPVADQQKLLTDLVKVALGLAAGIGAAFALVVGYRRARTEEASSHRDDSRLFSSRYQDAADLIGSDKAAVRLAGIYAMARLADDWEEQRQQCIDVLCAYLRLPYDPDPESGDLGEREVRYSVIGLIGSHLQPAAKPSWQGHNFDFNGAVFDGGDFRLAKFTGGTVVNFRGAKFTGGTVNFTLAEFADGDINFNGAEFSGGTVNFLGAKFTGGSVYFSDAKFAGGTVNFRMGIFVDGDVLFHDAEFSGGTVSFVGARFSGTDVDLHDAEFAGGNVTFSAAQFTGGTVSFQDADFVGGSVRFRRTQFSGGTVNFALATFAGGVVSFTDARFKGSTVAFREGAFAGSDVRFRKAEFAGGTVTFGDANFDGGKIDLAGAQFIDGTVDLSAARFNRGEVTFGDAQFAGGIVAFNEAVFDGGTVDLTKTSLSADGIKPQDLPTSPSTSLLLPDWLTVSSS
jgi:uncharacterized protein YjbI with pentapeptide repeats